MMGGLKQCVYSSVFGPDPNWIRIPSGQWIRIRNVYCNVTLLKVPFSVIRRVSSFRTSMAPEMRQNLYI